MNLQILDFLQLLEYLRVYYLFLLHFIKQNFLQDLQHHLVLKFHLKLLLKYFFFFFYYVCSYLVFAFYLFNFYNNLFYLFLFFYYLF